jgi:hypothetical protein
MQLSTTHREIMQTLFKNLLKISCGKTATNLNVRNLLSFYIHSLTPWQDHGEYARYPFNSMNLLKISLFVIFTRLESSAIYGGVNAPECRLNNQRSPSFLTGFTKIYHKSSVKSTLRYRKINFFTTPALFRLTGG